MGYAVGLYDLISKCMGLPSSRTLKKYNSPGANDPEFKEVILGLASQNWIVDTIVDDGATENRSCMKQLATISADVVLN